jgi:quercetin dioxygenase-like cupin family protein
MANLDKNVIKILQCTKDMVMAEKLFRENKISYLEQPDNYIDKVVIKPWGYEFLVFTNESVAVWLLYIKKGHSTSMHCHPNKTTSLTIINGNALCNTFKYRNFINGGDALSIDAGVFHSTKALSIDGIFVVEVESPPKKLDLLRLEDTYGREYCGYESHTQMVTKHLERFNYFHFSDGNLTREYEVIKNKVNISFQKLTVQHNKTGFTSLHPSSIYCVCKGKLELPEHKIISPGEIEYGVNIKDYSFKKSLLLMELNYINETK